MASFSTGSQRGTLGRSSLETNFASMKPESNSMETDWRRPPLRREAGDSKREVGEGAPSYK